MGMGQYVVAVPYSQDPTLTGPYVWSSQGAGAQFALPLGGPGCRVGDVVSQFIFLGDLYDETQQTFFTGDGTTTTVTTTIPTPIQDGGVILDQRGTLSANISNGTITGTEGGGGTVTGTINYATGAITVNFSNAPASGNAVYAQYVQSAPYRVWWSGIGDPTNWPTPLTNAALAVQSGYDDLDPTAGPVMYIAGYPLYGLVFQRYSITRVSYIGGNVIFSFQPFAFKRGLVAHGAAVKVGPLVYFLSDDGFYVTDGSNVNPIGTASDNSSGIDRWLETNLNLNSVDTIRSGYDSASRSIWFAIPTAGNTLPDTLLVYNLIAQKWTRVSCPAEVVFTMDNGADGAPGDEQILGVFDQNNVLNTLTGPTQPGYLETQDMYDATGNFRLLSGVIPMVESQDLPVVSVSTRDNLWVPLTLADSQAPDSFSMVAPIIAEGRYMRVRVSTVQGTNIQGATILSQPRKSY